MFGRTNASILRSGLPCLCALRGTVVPPGRAIKSLLGTGIPLGRELSEGRTSQDTWVCVLRGVQYIDAIPTYKIPTRYWLLVGLVPCEQARLFRVHSSNRFPCKFGLRLLYCLLSRSTHDGCDPARLVSPVSFRDEDGSKHRQVKPLLLL